MRWIVLGAVLPVIVASAVCADEVAPPTLVVRSGPGGQYRQVGVLKQGTPVQAIGQASRGYLPVSFAGGRGWVPQQFIRRSGQGASSQPGALGTNPFAPVAAPSQPATPGMATPGMTTPAPAAPATPSAPARPAAPLPPSSLPAQPGLPAQPAQPGPMLTTPVAPATPANPGFTPTPLGGASNTPRSNNSGGSSNPLGNILGSVGQSILGNVLGGSSSSQNSNPLTSALGNLAQSGGSGSNPLASLLGGSGGSNPLGSILGGNQSRGPSILNSQNTSPIPSGGTPAASAPGSSTPAAPGGNFSNPGAVGKTVTVTATQLFIRTGPGTQYRVIGTLFQGATVQVTNNSGAWFEHVQPSGLKGWSHGAYLNGGGGQNLAPASTIPGGPSVNPGATGTLPGSSGGGTPAGAGNERRSRAGFIQLRASGTGYYTYYTPSRKWGKPNVIYGIMRVGQRLSQGGLPQLGVGDISAENGGRISGHASHQRGVDVDCRLMYSDRVNRAGTISHPQYSSAWTTTAIRLFRAEIPTNLVLFNDRSVIRAGLSRNWPNHANHFHFRAN